MHAAGRVALGHFLVDDAPARRHPLEVAGGDGAAVAHAVAVLDGSGEDVGDGFDAAMRMPREAGQVIGRNVVAEVIEQEEGVEVGRVAEAERAAQMHARAFEGGLGLDQTFDRSDGHNNLLGSVSVRLTGENYAQSARCQPASNEWRVASGEWSESVISNQEPEG